MTQCSQRGHACRRAGVDTSTYDSRRMRLAGAKSQQRRARPRASRGTRSAPMDRSSPHGFERARFLLRAVQTVGRGAASRAKQAGRNSRHNTLAKRVWAGPRGRATTSDPIRTRDPADRGAGLWVIQSRSMCGPRRRKLRARTGRRRRAPQQPPGGTTRRRERRVPRSDTAQGEHRLHGQRRER